MKLLRMCVCVMVGITAYAAASDSEFDVSGYQSLTADKRAAEVGDTVTIIILENAQASSSAGNKAEGDFSMGVDASAKNKNGQPLWGTDVDVGMSSQQQGDAANKRNGFIRAQLTAVVTAVGDNQILVIEGKQSITIDGEEQTIGIKGKARSTDISSQNTLISTRLFDSEISFTGQGEVSDGKDSGFLYKAMKWLGLA